MLDKLLIGGIVWLASNPAGRKAAVKGCRVLAKLGDRAVKSMPGEISNIFRGAEKLVKELGAEERP